jgi:hypothetical protein
MWLLSKWLGAKAKAEVVPPTPLWERSPLTDSGAAAAQLASLELAPNVVAMNCLSLAKGAPALTDVRAFAKLLAASGERDNPRVYAEMLLASAVGPKLATAMLASDTVRARWDTIRALAVAPPELHELTRGDALRLSRELMSAQAVALRQALGSSVGDHAAAIAEHAPGLSLMAVRLMLEHANIPAPPELMRELQLQRDLRDMLRAGGEVAVAPLSVSEVLAHDSLRFDAFDLFIEANDKALSILAAMTDAMNAALEGKDSGAPSLVDSVTQLRGYVDHMLAWHSALYKNKTSTALVDKAAQLFAKLSAVTTEVSAVIATKPATTGGTTSLVSAPDFIKDPCNRLLEVCSKSKAEVDVKTIETLEELIRVLHRDAASGFGDFVRKSVTGGGSGGRGYLEEIRSSLSKSTYAKLTVITPLAAEDFAHTPMGNVGKVFRRYIHDSANGQMRISSAILTDKVFNFDVSLGAHTGRLAVTYDAAQKAYFLEWGMVEPGDGNGRLTFAAQYFPLMGFAHRIEGWKHTATRKVSEADMPKLLSFLLFSLENMRNIDLYEPQFDPPALVDLFGSWYACFTGLDGPLQASTLEDKVQELSQRMSHVFRMAGLNADRVSEASRLAIDAATTVVMRQASMLFDAPPDAATLTSALRQTTRACERYWSEAASADQFTPPEPLSDASLDKLLSADVRRIRLAPVGTGTANVSGFAFLLGPVHQYASHDQG